MPINNIQVAQVEKEEEVVEEEEEVVAQVEERATQQVRNSSEEEDVDMFESRVVLHKHLYCTNTHPGIR